MRLVFDIETVRQYKDYEDCPEEVKLAWESTAKTKFPDMEAGDAYHKKAALFPEFGKVVVISAIDDEEKKIVSFDGQMEPSNAEFTLLKQFKDQLEEGRWNYSTLIGHYIKGFDIPYLVVRMVANNISVPRLLKLYKTKPWEMGLIDTREVWKQGLYVTSQASSLVAVCLTLGVESPKNDISGSEVSDVYYSDEPGSLERIKRYCEADVMATAQVFNKMYKMNMV